MYPIDKSANNIAFICKKYYAQVLLKITFIKYYIKHLSTSEWILFLMFFNNKIVLLILFSD